MENIKVALVHDWLTGQRGGEKVLEVFSEIFPDAPIYTLIHFPGSQIEDIENKRIITVIFTLLLGMLGTIIFHIFRKTNLGYSHVFLFLPSFIK
jgi:predicted 3-demethylubiquinone-9 3-methyltransferase (glyoxalase superfamily)